MLGLAQCIQNLLILINPLIQLRLQLVLGHLDEEVSDEFGDGLAHCPHYDLEYCVQSLPQLIDEDVPAVGSWVGLVLRLLRDGLAILVVLDGHLVGLGYDRCAILLIIGVIYEEVVLLCIDNRFNELSRVVTLTLQYTHDDLHD